MNHNTELEVLHNLVVALDNSFWSSWQQTVSFDSELDAARVYLDKYHEEYINEYA